MDVSTHRPKYYQYTVTNQLESSPHGISIISQGVTGHAACLSYKYNITYKHVQHSSACSCRMRNKVLVQCLCRCVVFV